MSYICVFSQLHDKYHDFVTDPEREEFTAILQQVEDWLYEDGEDETKGVYVAKLEELKKVGSCAKFVFVIIIVYVFQLTEGTCSVVILLSCATRNTWRGDLWLIN